MYFYVYNNLFNSVLTGFSYNRFYLDHFVRRVLSKIVSLYICRSTCAKNIAFNIALIAKSKMFDLYVL